MSISIIAKPEVITPAYNPINWWVDSTNKSETGFKYVFDIYDASAVKIAEYRVAPRIDDGYGILDVSKLLSSKVSADLDLTNTTYYDATEHYFEYSVEVGEEYNVSYAYTGFTQSGDYVELTGFSSHPFVVGDQINTTETVPTNDLIGGLHTVVGVGLTTVIIDVLYDDMVSPSSTAGELIYADNRKSLTRSLSINANNFAFKGADTFKNFKDYDYTDYVLYTAANKFLTTMPDEFYASSTQEILVSYLPQTTATRRMYFENSAGSTFYKDVTPSSGEVVNYSGVLGSVLGILTLNSGVFPLIDDSIEWIEYSYVDNTNTKVSETKRIYIDHRCKQETFEILFLDRLGSWSSFNFMLKAQEKETVSREVYNKDLTGTDDSGSWTYETTDKGFKVHSVDVEKEYTLNTNWMTQEMNEYFAELVSSPETYIKLTTDDDVYYSCLIKDTTSEVVRQKGKNLIRKTIKVELSNKEIVNG